MYGKNCRLVEKCHGCYSQCQSDRSIYRPLDLRCTPTRGSQSRKTFVSEETMVVGTKTESIGYKSVFLPLKNYGHCSLVVKVTNSRPACHEFEASTAEDSPCRKGRYTLNLSRLKCPLVDVVWKIKIARVYGIWALPCTNIYLTDILTSIPQFQRKLNDVERFLVLSYLRIYGPRSESRTTKQHGVGPLERSRDEDT
ncbi:hypothetical protein TNCV_4414351 [Trichonephila clavipes]|uniref:Uncharacterized protein n=1 Tax=Trichonephila clavipes TaxID=2585209 RepID=A0A8X6S7M0_TRICX|nr:hypothetical protein TNCV_4414351 [Trichonephila clavipes]